MLRRSLAAVEILWTASCFAAAYVVGRAHGGAIAHALALVDYAAGSLVCHQRPERSFHVWGAQLPVCARCTGVYVGAAVVSLRAAPRRILRSMRVLVAAATPAAATLLYEWTTGVTPANWIRAATGVVIGAAVMAVLAGELRED